MPPVPEAPGRSQALQEQVRHRCLYGGPRSASCWSAGRSPRSDGVGPRPWDLRYEATA